MTTIRSRPPTPPTTPPTIAPTCEEPPFEADDAVGVGVEVVISVVDVDVWVDVEREEDVVEDEWKDVNAEAAAGVIRTSIVRVVSSSVH
jgi:hypothetical protein